MAGLLADSGEDSQWRTPRQQRIGVAVAMHGV
jgi:hypothetical protein